MVREEWFWAPVRQWYAWQLKHRGYVRPYRDWCLRAAKGRHVREVRWEWPPLPGKPTHGWRASWMAWHYLWQCHKERIDLRPWLWRRLKGMASNGHEFPYCYHQQIERRILQARAARIERKKRREPPRLTLTLGAGGIGLGWRPRL